MLRNQLAKCLQGAKTSTSNRNDQGFASGGDQYLVALKTKTEILKLKVLGYNNRTLLSKEGNHFLPDSHWARHAWGRRCDYVNKQSKNPTG